MSGGRLRGVREALEDANVDPGRLCVYVLAVLLIVLTLEILQAAGVVS